MAPWIAAGLAGLLLTAPAASAQSPITEPQVQALLQTLDQAAQSLDTDALMTHFADDAVVTLVVPGPDGHQTFRWDKEEYARQLDEGYQEIEEYRFERTDTAIQIAPDGRSARVTATMTETIRMRGQRIYAVTQDDARLELRQGRLMVTRLDGVVLEFERQDAVDAV
ncbi:MAG: nuclear transport factor 2 family protein [Nitrospirota bacterium]